MPFHLPDEDSIVNCRMVIKIPNDEKWVSVIIGQLAQLAKPENWEAGTGVLTVDEAVEAAKEIVDLIDFQAC